MRFILVLSVLFLTGCADHAPCWVVRRGVPTTEAERKAITEHVEKILAATPRALSGHDQDWDDAIKEAHKQARETLCRVTMWEIVYDGVWRDTGRWRYADEIPAAK
jgi:hypothetical protein